MYAGIETFGKNAVVCGRSKNVGLPIALLLHADGAGETEACQCQCFAVSLEVLSLVYNIDCRTTASRRLTDPQLFRVRHQVVMFDLHFLCTHSRLVYFYGDTQRKCHRFCMKFTRMTMHLLPHEDYNLYKGPTCGCYFTVIHNLTLPVALYKFRVHFSKVKSTRLSTVRASTWLQVKLYFPFLPRNVTLSQLSVSLRTTEMLHAFSLAELHLVKFWLIVAMVTRSFVKHVVR